MLQNTLEFLSFGFFEGGGVRKFSHLSSTSWNTQLGVCVVVKMRLSGGILGAVKREEIFLIKTHTHNQTYCSLSMDTIIL